MMKRLMIGSGAALVALATSSGIAAAEPNVDAIVNSPCSYPQVMAALEAQSPATASQFRATPAADAWLRQLVAAPPEQRRVMVASIQGIPGLAEYTGLINSVAGSCTNF